MKIVRIKGSCGYYSDVDMRTTHSFHVGEAIDNDGVYLHGCCIRRCIFCRGWICRPDYNISTVYVSTITRNEPCKYYLKEI